METLTHRQESLAAAYIRSQRPSASPAEIGNMIARLRDAIQAGELDIDKVLERFGAFSPHRSHAFGDMARACRDLDGGRLTPRECAFVKKMVALGFNRSPTERQHQWLADIFERLGGRAAA